MDYPEAKGFVTLTDEKGQHLIFHGDCGGRPVFLSDDRVLASACKIAEITLDDPVSFAGVSQNGKRFALQVATYYNDHSVKQERFVIYSVDKGDGIAEMASPQLPEAQSWTAFSPDGSLFVVGSPLKLTLYRLP